MKIIDEKDRKILLELDKDARQTDSEIAKKVRVSKQVANVRIKKLRERGIITNFYTIVSTGQLGLNSHYIFLQLEKINSKEEKELLQKLSKLDYVGWLVNGVGRWDVVVLVYADTIDKFDKILNEIIESCGDHVHEYDFTTLIQSEHISYKFLGNKGTDSATKQTERKQKTVLEDKDKKILEALSQNARMPIVELAEKTNIPLHIVHYHLKRLLKEKIIEGFKPKINVAKLGYQWHLLLIQFHKITEQRKEQFINFCKSHEKIYYVTNTLGKYNLMLDVHVKSPEEFRYVLLELKEEFSDLIKIYESIIIFEEFKINYFPKDLV